MERFTGTVVVRMNGNTLRSEADASLEMGGFERNEKYADGRLQGFSKKPVACKVTAKLLHSATSDMQTLADAEDVTLIFETDTGRTFTVAHAWTMKPPHLTGGDGVMAIEFMGPPAIEA